MTALLSVADLQVHFPTAAGLSRAVDGISFELKEGQITGLVGESGCGKSVTALAILGLLPAKAARVRGRVMWRGQDLLTLAEAEWRQIRGCQIAMIFQDPMSSLNPVFTVGDQIREVLRLHLGLGKRAADDRAAQLLDLVGIDEPRRRLRSYPGELSGGMRQRVMIAMAMAGEPKLLIADEPTTALDVTTQAQVLRLLDRVREKTGTAVLFITHDLGVVAELCEQVVVLYAGNVAEAGSAKQLFDEPLHPYTQGLLRAVGNLERGGIEAAIPGRIAPATNYPSGCRFHPRCSHTMAVCREKQPPEFQRAGSRAACWLLDGSGETG
jgi:peptide/nickel transport system ATP-binding protein